MSQPQPSEGVVQNPFEQLLAQRLEHFAALAGGTLTAREVAIFTAGYEGGRVDQATYTSTNAVVAGQSPTAAPAASAESDPAAAQVASAPATAESTPEPGSVAETLFKPDTLSRRIMSNAGILVYRWMAGGGGSNRHVTPPGEALNAALSSEDDALVMGAPDEVLDVAIDGVREAIAFSPFPEEHRNLITLPEGTDPEEPLVVIEYLARGRVSGSSDEVLMQLVWPASQAYRLAEKLPKNPRAASNAAQVFVSSRIKQLKAEGGDDMEAAVERASTILLRLQKLDENFEGRGDEQVLTVLSSVDGIGPQQNREDGIAQVGLYRPPKDEVPKLKR